MNSIRTFLPGCVGGAALVAAAGVVLAAAVVLAAQQSPPTDGSADPTGRAGSFDSAAASQPATDAPATDANTAPAGDPSMPPRQPTAEEVIRALQRSMSPVRPIVPPDSARDIRSTVGGAPQAVEVPLTVRRSGKLLPEGYRIVDRPGRMVRGPSGNWLYSFEERGTGDADQPMALLPNRYLEQMESVSEGGTLPVVFLVSGDVTEYRGENYLLVQKLLIRPNLGNLK